MAAQPSEMHGSPNAAELPPEVHLDMSSREMVTHQATEDMSSKDKIFYQANQYRRKIVKEVRERVSSKAAALTKGPALIRRWMVGKSTRAESKDCDKESNPMAAQPSEMHESPNAAEPQPDMSSRETVTDQATKDMSSKDKIMSSRETVTDQATKDMSSKDKIINRAKQYRGKMIKEVREGKSLKGAAALIKDYRRWMVGKSTRAESESPRPVVNKEYRPPVVNKEHRPLLKAAAEGDWEKIEKILSENHTAMTTEVMNVEGEAPLTLLDVAITAEQDQLVENLVKHFPPDCTELHLDRAFRHAARGGRIRIVKALIDKIENDSTIIRDTICDALKLATESALAQKEVIWYLARHLNSAPEFEVLINLIKGGHLDICLYLVHNYPDLANFEETEGLRLSEYLTRYFQSGATLNWWKKYIYKFIPLCLFDISFDDSEDMKMARALNWFKISLWNLVMIPAPFIKGIGELKLRHYCSLELAKLALEKMAEDNSDTMLKTLLDSRFILDAASCGAFEIVKCCLENFPELMWYNSFAKELTNKIVKGRHVELFRLVNTYKPFRGKVDGLMEAVTNWSPRCVSPDVSGAAFLMQRELQWFQVVETSYPSYEQLKPEEGRKSYWEQFVDQRKKLVKEAGKWMKDTSSSCSVVATLIITITFAAAFAVPGGNDNSAGTPIFLRSVLSIAFMVANAIALFCSVAATLVFLAILTSSYAIDDFHHTLPRRMILGLTFLFLSLAFMLVAFGSALSIILSDRLKWTYILFTSLAGFPVVLFAILQLLPLYIKMVESTARPRLYRPLKLWK